MRIYTKTGDTGETSLFSGGRVAKDHLRVEAYGCLDELSSVIGLVRSEELPDEVAQRLLEVQDLLLVIGGVLADPEGRSPSDPAAWDPEPLERWIDAMEGTLEPLTSFILPGGCRSASLAHVARTVCRRAERRVATVQRELGALPPGITAYLNRLSDALFVLARFLNAAAGAAEPRWESPASRRRSGRG